MAGYGEMFQELEDKRRDEGFFPKLHKASPTSRHELYSVSDNVARPVRFRPAPAPGIKMSFRTVFHISIRFRRCSKYCTGILFCFYPEPPTTLGSGSLICEQIICKNVKSELWTVQKQLCFNEAILRADSKVYCRQSGQRLGESNVWKTKGGCCPFYH